MKKSLLLLFCSFALIGTAQIQQHPRFEWVKTRSQLYVPQMDVRTMTTDAAGNTWVMADFTGTLELDGFTLNCQKGQDIAILKYNAQEELLWAAQANGPGFKFPGKIKLTSDGGALVAGYFFTKIDFGAIQLQQKGATHPSYIAKLDANGNWVWATLAGTGSVGDIQEDLSGNFYISGELLADGHFEPVFPNILRSNDAYVGKMDTRGNWLWVKTYGSDNDPVYSSTYPAAIHLHQDKLYLVGSFLRNTDITGDENTPKHFQTKNQTNYLALMDTNGQWQWSTFVDGDLGLGLTRSMVDDAGNLYLLGTFVSELWLGTEKVKVGCRHAAMLMKVNAQGNLAWYKPISSPLHHSDIWGGPMTFGTESFGVGSINFSGHAALDSLSFTCQSNTKGYQDIMMFSFDSSGNIGWTKQVGSENNARLYSLSPLDDSAYLLMGAISGETYFDNELVKFESDPNFNFLAKMTIGSTPVKLIPRGSTIQFVVYPNPIKGTFQLNYPLDSDTKLTLFSLQGKKCAEWPGQAWSNYTLPTSLPIGFYFLRIRNDQNTQVIRVQID